MDLHALTAGSPAEKRAVLSRLLGGVRDGPLDPEALRAVAEVAADDDPAVASYAIKVLWRSASLSHDLSAADHLLQRAVGHDDKLVAYQAAASLALTHLLHGGGPTLASLLQHDRIAVREGAGHGASLGTARGGSPPVDALAAALSDEADGVLENVLSALLLLALRGDEVSAARAALRHTLSKRAYTVAGHTFVTPEGSSEWRGQSPARDAAAVLAVDAARGGDLDALRQMLDDSDAHVAQGTRKGLARLRTSDPALAADLDSRLR